MDPVVFCHYPIPASGPDVPDEPYTVPIGEAASVVSEDARTLSVTPWDKSMVGPIEKAILTSDLGLNPTTAGQVIRIPLPPLTEERRVELGKVVHHEGENAKIAIRNIRRDAINHVKELEKEKEISVDDDRRAEHDIQLITDEHIVGFLTSSFSLEGVGCNIYRTFEMFYSG